MEWGSEKGKGWNLKQGALLVDYHCGPLGLGLLGTPGRQGGAHPTAVPPKRRGVWRTDGLTHLSLRQLPSTMHVLQEGQACSAGRQGPRRRQGVTLDTCRKGTAERSEWVLPMCPAQVHLFLCVALLRL